MKGKVTKKSMVKAALDRIEKLLTEHPELRERTAEMLKGELECGPLEEEMAGMVQLVLRVPEEWLEHAERMVLRLEKYGSLAATGQVTKSTVLRLALQRGLEQLEDELPPSKSKRRPKPKRKER